MDSNNQPIKSVVEALAWAPVRQSNGVDWNGAYVGFRNGNLFYTKQVSAANKWKQTANPWGTSPVTGIGVDSLNPDVAVVSIGGVTGGVYFNGNAGQGNWALIGGGSEAKGGLPSGRIGSVVLDSQPGQRTLYAGTNVGVYAANLDANLQLTWTRVGDPPQPDSTDGLPFVMVNDLQFQRYKNGAVALVAGTSGRSAWQFTLKYPEGRQNGQVGVPNNADVVFDNTNGLVAGGNYTFLVYNDNGTGNPYAQALPSQSVTVGQSTGPNTYDVSTNLTFQNPGTYHILVQAWHGNPSDGTGTLVTQKSVEFDVHNPPVSATGQDFNAIEGATFTGTVATFVDPLGNGASGAYTATVDWGDGQTSPGTVTSGTNALSVQGSHVYAEDGYYDVQVQIARNGDGSDPAIAVVGAAIADAPLRLAARNVSAVANSPTGQVVIATFTDPGSDGTAIDYTAAINWGDGHTSTGVVQSANDGSFQVLGVHQYVEKGTYAVSVTVADTAGSTVTATSTAAVLIGDANVLVSSAGPSTFGEPITFTAQVAGADGGTPTGLVLFSDGGTTLATVALGAPGSASFTTSNLAPGSHAIVATYQGDATYASSTSGLTQVLNTVTGALRSMASLTSSAPQATVGTAITFTATVRGSDGGTPMGSVAFLDGNQSLATANLSTSGTASFTTSSLAVGFHAITALYVGDATYPGSTAALTQGVNPTRFLLVTSTSLASSANPSSVDQALTFTAAVASRDGGATPTGMVVFTDGGSTLGTVALSAGGTAALTVSTLSVNSHAIAAVYGGDATHDGSAALLPEVVNPNGGTVATTVVLDSSFNSSEPGDTVTITAAVAGSDAGVPTGIVWFFDGTTALGSANLTGSGTATITTSGLALGSHVIVALYDGDATYAVGSATFQQEVVAAVTTVASTTTLASSADPSTAGQSVTFTATVTGADGGTPTGSVVFSDGTSVLGIVDVDASGRASFSTAGLSAGSHTITATYGGDIIYAGSVATLAQTVRGATTYTGLTSSSDPSVYGQAVTFTATVVTPNGGAPSGVVTFSDGTTILGSVNVDSSGHALFTTSSLLRGVHDIFATYSGDATFASSQGGLEQGVQ